MNEDAKEIESYIKKAIYKETLQSGQSARYFETSWNIWWGLMDSDYKNGLIKGIQKLLDDCTKDCGG